MTEEPGIEAGVEVEVGAEAEVEAEAGAELVSGSVLEAVPEGMFLVGVGR